MDSASVTVAVMVRLNASPSFTVSGAGSYASVSVSRGVAMKYPRPSASDGIVAMKRTLPGDTVDSVRPLSPRYTTRTVRSSIS